MHLAITILATTSLAACGSTMKTGDRTMGHGGMGHGNMGHHAMADNPGSHHMGEMKMGHGGGAHGMQSDACPMAVSGTEVAVSDTDDGVALTFTTAPKNVEDLRTKVQQMAAMHNKGHSNGGMHEGHAVASSTAVVEEVGDGSRVVVTPSTPGGLAGLRAHVRKNAKMMQGGKCPMAGGQSDSPGGHQH